jgi:hypothetical protein
MGEPDSYRVEPLTDAELKNAREKAVNGRSACLAGQDDEIRLHWDEVLSLIAEVRRLRGTLDDRIQQAHGHLTAIQERSKSPAGTALGERIIGDAAGRYSALQEFRRAVYGNTLDF